MDETTLTEDLDERGLLDDAHGPGCYSIRLDVPDDLRERWDAEFDAAPDGLFDRIEAADALLYAGASTNVYSRLCDHAAGEVRKAAIMRVCPPSHVVDVMPTETPFENEYNYALSCSGPGTVVWCDGDLI